MTFSADRNLLAVDSCKVERKALHSLSTLSDVSDVVHLYMLTAAADGTVIQKPGLGSPWPPSGQYIQVRGRPFGLFDLSQRFVEKVRPSAIGFHNG